MHPANSMESRDIKHLCGSFWSKSKLLYKMPGVDIILQLAGVPLGIFSSRERSSSDVTSWNLGLQPHYVPSIHFSSGWGKSHEIKRHR
jgi:hypothetical protein